MLEIVDWEEESFPDLPLGCFHENWRRDTAIQTGEAFVFDDLAETVDHSVVCLFSSSLAGLELSMLF